jgi:hypothetical protein
VQLGDHFLTVDDVVLTSLAFEVDIAAFNWTLLGTVCIFRLHQQCRTNVGVMAAACSERHSNTRLSLHALTIQRKNRPFDCEVVKGSLRKS